MKVSIRDVAEECGVLEVPEVILRIWNDKICKLNNDNILELLNEKYLTETARYLGVPSPAIKSLNDAAKTVCKSEALKALLLVMHNFAYDTEEPLSVIGKQWFYPTKGLKEHAAIFPVLVFLCGFDKVSCFYDKYNLPEKILLETFKCIELWLEHYYMKNGIWGISEASFFLNYFRNKIFRLGSLQYMHKAWNYSQCPIVYTNKMTGEVISFSEPGIKYRNDGLVEGTNNCMDTNAWTALLELSENRVKGNLLKGGYACKEEVAFSTHLWEKTLERGMPILDLHIPRGVSLKVDDVRQSLTDAMCFYHEYFPEKKYYAFTCYTWLFDPTLRKILKEGSNLMKFQDVFHTYPVLSDDKDTLRFVFGNDFDINTAPRDTSLRRGIIKHMEQGGRFHIAAGFLLKGEV